MKSTIRAGVLVGAFTLAAAAPALAAPVTVNLRVEGATRTLIEAPITVDVRTFKFSDSSEQGRCDAMGSTGGTAAVPSPTRGGALAEYVERNGISMTGRFFDFGPQIDTIAGENVEYDPDTDKYLTEYKNFRFASVGGCADPVVNGDEALFAFGNFGGTALKLSGPATVAPGASATLTVVEGEGEAPVAGAAAAGKTSGADGKIATAPLTQRGLNAFKATKAGAIRSNAVSVCVTDGADGFCGTSKPGEPTPPAASGPAPSGPLFGGDDTSSFAKITSLEEQKTYELGDAPRELKGTVDEDLVGVDEVRLRISRRDGNRCFKYVGASNREEFVRTRKCSIKSSRTFKVGEDRSWEYLLPADLEKGRYVLDVIVKDRAGNQTRRYQRGRNRVVFFVK